MVPTLDEEAAVRELLPDLVGRGAQVVVSDGGSSDRTAEVAAKLGAEVVSGPAGRGAQLNRGSAAADAEILLFLHADTRLPEGALERIREALAAGSEGGGFLMRWDSPRPIYRLGERIINRRTRLTRCPLGDQAQFCRRDVFEELGGYRDWPILEDLDFIRRLRRRGRLAILEPPVTTSARRLERRGIPRTVATNWLIFALYLIGVSPQRLGRLYRQVR